MGMFDWHKVIMFICFAYAGISFEFVYIQLLPLLSNFEAYAMPPPPFAYDPSYKTSPSYVYYIILTSLFGSLVSLLAGISLYNLTKKKENESTSDAWIKNITSNDEKAAISLIKKSGNEITQSGLAKELGLSKVRIHRALKKLEGNNIIERRDYGSTKKITLKDMS